MAWFKGMLSKSDNKDSIDVERQLSDERKNLKKAEKLIEELTRKLESTEFQLNKIWNENQSIKSNHENELNTIFLAHSQQTEDTKKNHTNYIKKLNREHTTDVEQLNRKYTTDIEELNKKHTGMVSKLQSQSLAKENKLIGQLLDNQKDTHAWHEDKLKLVFKNLQNLINSVSSPHHKELQFPQHMHLRSAFDPTDFLSRAGREKFHFLLRSVIWSILREQFFGAPFGFGALGPEAGQKELHDIYFRWRSLLDGRLPSGSDEFIVFSEDTMMNQWRTTSFQSISVSLTENKHESMGKVSPLVKLNTDNIQQTFNRIVGLFSEVSRLSHTSVSSEVESQIRQIIDLASQIGLQFGVQTAHLLLEVPESGEQVEIGVKYSDCEDGDCNKGSLCTVDLVTVPGLLKIGDGRSDKGVMRVIVPCEFYPQE